MSTPFSLTSLGWKPFFQQQLSHEEWDNTVPARISEQHRSTLKLIFELGELNLPIHPQMPPLVVGDWVLLDHTHQFIRPLERRSCFQRKSAGSKSAQQLISANVDTAFIVSSLNRDFNLNRIERFLALVNDAGAEPVIVLSKADLCEMPDQYIEQVQALDPLLNIVSINCLASTTPNTLRHWLTAGATVAVLGSSGVGKSTLINTLSHQRQSTGPIREDDDKGRHTTTSRSLVQLANGAMLIDTPGMREIQLSDCSSGLATTFADIETLAQSCRFSNCQHQSEPGCRVQQAIEASELDPRRLNNYLKLLREDSLNSASLAQKRASDKALGRYYKQVLGDVKKIKRGN